jgi:hypothetical protein
MDRQRADIRTDRKVNSNQHEGVLKIISRESVSSLALTRIS